MSNNIKEQYIIFYFAINVYIQKKIIILKVMKFQEF